MPFRLGETDSTTYGLNDWVDYSPLAITVDDLEFLSSLHDFDPGDEWPEVLRGLPTLADAGNADWKPTPPRWRNRAVVWMLLRQNGHQISWEEAGTVRYFEIRFRRPAVEPVVVESGKESPPSSDSPRSGGSTTRRSRSSSSTPRKKPAA